jgi:hypothetical protein
MAQYKFLEALIHDLSVNDHSMLRVGATLIASVSGQDIRSNLKARGKIIVKLSDLYKCNSGHVLINNYE